MKERWPVVEARSVRVMQDDAVPNCVGESNFGHLVARSYDLGDLAGDALLQLYSDYRTAVSQRLQV